MLRPPILVLPTLAVLALAAVAQEPRKPGSPAPSAASSPIAKGGGPPGITVVDGVRDGMLEVRKTTVTSVPETYTVQETVPVTVEGKTVNKTVVRQAMRIKPVQQTQLESHALSEIQVYDNEGRPVARERIPALFSNPRMVLTATRGLPVDPAYLMLVRPGTYLVVLPMSAPVLPAPTSDVTP